MTIMSFFFRHDILLDLENLVYVLINKAYNNYIYIFLLVRPAINNI